MKINTRNWIALTAALLTTGMLVAMGPTSLQAADALDTGKLTQESLGNLLKALNLKPTTLETRYDFRFQANHDEAWALSMSAVLSNDGETLWIMAWLDELPSSAREVPRVRLLTLLADNDKMGGGKFFSYIPGNRRFVLQRVVANRNITTKKFVGLLSDLGKTVAETHGHWNVEAWTDPPESSKPQTAKTAETAAASSKDVKTTKRATPASGTKAPRTATQTKRPTTKRPTPRR